MTPITVQVFHSESAERPFAEIALRGCAFLPDALSIQGVYFFREPNSAPGGPPTYVRAEAAARPAPNLSVFVVTELTHAPRLFGLPPAKVQ